MNLAVVDAGAHRPGTRLGDVWLVAATVAAGIIDGLPADDAYVVTMSRSGEIVATPTQHPDFIDQHAQPGFVCTAMPGCDIRQLAARLRDAAFRWGVIEEEERAQTTRFTR